MRARVTISRLTRRTLEGNDAPVHFSRVLALVLVALIAGLAPAAYADPPDPSWLGGYWDDDDFDNVVVFLLGTVAVVELASPHPGAPVAAVGIVEVPDGRVVAAPVDATASPRAPPLISAA
jgi:hypothetical protein